MRHIRNAFLFSSLSLLAFGSALSDELDKGRDVYLSYCLACHAFACNRDGAEAYSPRLAGVIGRKAGGLEDFTGYSKTMKASNVVWSEDTLHAFFVEPTAVVPGIRTPEFHKVLNVEEVTPLIEFLKTEDPSVDIFCAQ